MYGPLVEGEAWLAQIERTPQWGRELDQAVPRYGRGSEGYPLDQELTAPSSYYNTNNYDGNFALSLSQCVQNNILDINRSTQVSIRMKRETSNMC